MTLPGVGGENKWASNCMLICVHSITDSEDINRESAITVSLERFRCNTPGYKSLLRLIYTIILFYVNRP